MRLTNYQHSKAAGGLRAEAVDRVQECGNAEGRWLFLDASRNPTRRSCDGPRPSLKPQERRRRIGPVAHFPGLGINLGERNVDGVTGLWHASSLAFLC